MSPEEVMRWGFTTAALVALAAFAAGLYTTAGLLVASLVVLVVAGALAVALWVRELNAAELRAQQAKVRVPAEPAPPAADQSIGY